jgi:hypothetical protein
MIHQVFREKQRLDNIFSLVDLMGADTEILAHWAQYLCVLTSGFIENSLRHILQDYVMKHSNAQITSYVENRIEGITNLNEERIAQILGSFSPDWRQRFRSNLKPEQKDAIDSVIATRHLISHGRPVGITLSRIKSYYFEIAKIIKLIDEECVNK